MEFAQPGFVVAHCVTPETFAGVATFFLAFHVFYHLNKFHNYFSIINFYHLVDFEALHPSELTGLLHLRNPIRHILKIKQ